MKRRRVTEVPVFLLVSIYGGVLGKCLPKKGVIFHPTVIFFKPGYFLGGFSHIRLNQYYSLASLDYNFIKYILNMISFCY